ncbi:MAG: hypothetical protein AAF530_01430 [Pseudomonadota bacterium]
MPSFVTNTLCLVCLSVLLAAGMVLPLQAGSKLEDGKLSGEEIAALLTDRTALGEHRGVPTRQFFAAAGWTDYLAKGTQPDRGRWKVDMEQGKYCSEWNNSGKWPCYDIMREDGTLYWVQGDHYKSPFSMTDGHKMSFAE